MGHKSVYGTFTQKISGRMDHILIYDPLTNYIRQRMVHISIYDPFAPSRPVSSPLVSPHHRSNIEKTSIRVGCWFTSSIIFFQKHEPVSVRQVVQKKQTIVCYLTDDIDSLICWIILLRYLHFPRIPLVAFIIQSHRSSFS